MRDISASLKAKLLAAQQTLYNNANPQMEVLAMRPRIPIDSSRYWQETIVAEATTATYTSAAIRRESSRPDRVYYAYISGGVLTVKTALLTRPYDHMIWSVVLTIADCIACSLDFDGYFEEGGMGVEYHTDPLPWLIYLTSGGQLMAGILGETPESLVGANVTALDTIRGVANFDKTLDQGLVVFYILDSVVYYRQRVAGAWGGQETDALFPANAVKIRAERTFDWRLVLQIQDAAGAVHEVFTKMYASGWNGYEYLTAAAINPTVDITEINYPEAQDGDDEVITMAGEATGRSYGDAMPLLYQAWNIDDGLGDWGKYIMVRWTDTIDGIPANLGAFKITDAYNTSYYPSAITPDPLHNRLMLTFDDFNNAANPISVIYTPGSLTWLDGAAVSADSVDFDAYGLVPTFIPAPVVTSIYSVDNRTIRIAFDLAIISIGSQSGFAITGSEPFTSPEGQLVAATYGVDSIAAYDANTIQINLTYAGRMKHPQGTVNILFTGQLYGPGNTPVASFSQAFTPAGIVPWFKPNDPEYITLAPIATLTCFDVTYKQGKNGDEYLTAAGYTATLTVTNVGGLPL